MWVEVKHRRGLAVAKTRFLTTRASLPALLRGGTPPESPDQAEFARVRGLRGLVPTVVVDYRRRSYESADGALRLTFDADLSARSVGPDYFDLAPIELGDGASLAALGDARIFEIKLLGRGIQTPRWLHDALRDTRPDGFSKAAAALRMVAPPRLAHGVEI